MARLWADPEHCARISGQIKAKWADPTYRGHAGASTATNHWQHLESGRIDFRTKLEMLEMLEKRGFRLTSLDGHVSRPRRDGDSRRGPCGVRARRAFP